MLGVAANTSITAPYRTLVTHGFALDHNGHKMSKSLGNVIMPSKIISGKLAKYRRFQRSARPKHIGNRDTAFLLDGDTKSRGNNPSGADTLRLWVASCDYTKDVSISEEVIKSTHRNIRRLRMTFKWILGVLNLLEPSLGIRRRDVNTGSRFADTLILHCLQLTAHTVHADYSKFNHARAIAAINNFINHDLSAFYFETAKDRLYAGIPTERAAAQHVLLIILDQIAGMIGPITPMLVEEIVAHTPRQLKQWLSREHQADCEGEWHPLRSVW